MLSIKEFLIFFFFFNAFVFQIFIKKKIYRHKFTKIGRWKTKEKYEKSNERNFTILFTTWKKFESINFYTQIEKFHVLFFFNRDNILIYTRYSSTFNIGYCHFRFIILTSEDICEFSRYEFVNSISKSIRTSEQITSNLEQ